MGNKFCETIKMKFAPSIRYVKGESFDVDSFIDKKLQEFTNTLTEVCGFDGDNIAATTFVNIYPGKRKYDFKFHLRGKNNGYGDVEVQWDEHGLDSENTVAIRGNYNGVEFNMFVQLTPNCDHIMQYGIELTKANVDFKKEGTKSEIVPYSAVNKNCMSSISAAKKFTMDREFCEALMDGRIFKCSYVIEYDSTIKNAINMLADACNIDSICIRRVGNVRADHENGSFEYDISLAPLESDSITIALQKSSKGRRNVQIFGQFNGMGINVYTIYSNNDNLVEYGICLTKDNRSFEAKAKRKDYSSLGLFWADCQSAMTQAKRFASGEMKDEDNSDKTNGSRGSLAKTRGSFAPKQQAKI